MTPLRASESQLLAVILNLELDSTHTVLLYISLTLTFCGIVLLIVNVPSGFWRHRWQAAKGTRRSGSQSLVECASARSDEQDSSLRRRVWKDILGLALLLGGLALALAVALAVRH